MALQSASQKTARASALAPFAVRSFRFQWPADLATSWAFEMETLILGWYVLVETRSVLMLTLFASLQHIGTLLAPMFGVMGDRVGHRTVLATMRAIYTTLALTLMTLAYSGLLTPAYVLAIAGVMGLVRPSDIGMRTALVGATMPSDKLMGAMSIQRTTQDSAKVAGALTGAGLVALLGIGPAYTVVASFYALSIILTLQGAAPETGTGAPTHTAVVDVTRASPWGDLRAGMAYVWNTPLLLASMCFAFLLNCTAFPMMNGLMPVMAKEIYHTDQTGLGYLVAAGGFGALMSSVVISRIGHRIRPARMMIIFSAGWLLSLMVFANTTHPAMGIPFLLLAGLSQGLGQIPMATMLIRNCDAQFRGRIMGIRMLAIYGNIPGLLLAGWLIQRMGYPTTVTLYGAVALIFIVIVVSRWRTQLWRRDAAANSR
ncbi:MAG TPA: MFS transporter [Burkholderiales bacterium]|nr:MFS transporter [Burkholderiales bacterium]